MSKKKESGNQESSSCSSNDNSLFFGPGQPTSTVAFICLAILSETSELTYNDDDDDDDDVGEQAAV